MKARSFLALALLTFALAGCAETEVVTPEPVTEPVVEVESEGDLFVSEGLGFQLTTPEDWKVGTKMEETQWAFGTTDTIYFTNDVGLDLFAVTRFTTDEWASVLAAGDLRPVLITENEEFVWAYDQTQDPTGVETLLEDLDEVIASFELID